MKNANNLFKTGMTILLIITAPLCILFLGIMGWLKMFED
jgi:hypothetical protein